MSALLDTVRAQSRNLPSDEKLLLGVELIDSVWLEQNDEESPEAVTKAWDEEIQRRVEQVRNGQAKLVPWQDVLSRTNVKFGWDK